MITIYFRYWIREILFKLLKAFNEIPKMLKKLHLLLTISTERIREHRVFKESQHLFSVDIFPSLIWSFLLSLILKSLQLLQEKGQVHFVKRMFSYKIEANIISQLSVMALSYTLIFRKLKRLRAEIWRESIETRSLTSAMHSIKYYNQPAHRK